MAADVKTELKPWYKTKLPPGKVYQLDTDLDKLWDGLDDVGIGPRYIGEIRKGYWHVELGGPKHNYKSFLYAEVVNDPNEIVDGRVEVVGPELNEIPPETSLPFSLHAKLWGPELTEDHEEFAARGMFMGLMFLEGVGVIGARDTIWVRISKEVTPRLSFKKISQSLRANVLTSAPIVEAVEIKWVLGTPEIGGVKTIEEILEETKPKWEALMAKHAAIADEDVDLFYGCTLCKMIAPNHACIITPAIVPYCGVLSYYTCKAIHDIDPHGYIFELPKGETIDPVAGRFSGVDDAIYERSDHRHKIFHLHSAIKYVTTN
jgi:acetyl-CoA decarbonylase/synthase complex subunit beta